MSGCDIICSVAASSHNGDATHFVSSCSYLEYGSCTVFCVESISEDQCTEMVLYKLYVQHGRISGYR